MLQKKAIRIINFANYYAPTNPLFIKQNTLKFHDLVDFNTAVMMYKAHNLKLPHSVQDLFKLKENRYSFRDSGNFYKPKARTNLKSRCISVRGVGLWNNLDEQLKGSKTINAFKKSFKSRIIENYRALD